MLSLSGCSAPYILRASLEELSILASRKPLNELIAAKEKNETRCSPLGVQSGLPEESANQSKLREVCSDELTKLRLVTRVLAFARAQGLNPGGSFSSYSVLDRPHVSYVVMAAPRDELSFLTWWFPIVGAVPYKGYFDKDDALEAAKRLEADGFETIVRPVDAFSTLGWFDDPLLSTMLHRDPVALANLIFHESVHSTLWIPGAADFNESLANFIATWQTTKFFQQETEPLNGLALQAKLEELKDFKASRLISAVTARLTEVYKSFKESNSSTDQRSQQELQELRQAALEDTLRPFPIDLISGLRLDAVNNAHILGLSLYLSHQEDFRKVANACGENLVLFLRHMRLLPERERRQHTDVFTLLGEDARNFKCIPELLH